MTKAWVELDIRDEIVVQKALDKFPNEKPRIISDHGTQFIAKDFKKFIRYAGLVHTFTSVGYPQSNGKGGEIIPYGET